LQVAHYCRLKTLGRDYGRVANHAHLSIAVLKSLLDILPRRRALARFLLVIASLAILAVLPIWFTPRGTEATATSRLEYLEAVPHVPVPGGAIFFVPSTEYQRQPKEPDLGPLTADDLERHIAPRVSHRRDDLRAFLSKARPPLPTALIDSPYLVVDAGSLPNGEWWVCDFTVGIDRIERRPFEPSILGHPILVPLFRSTR